MKSVKNTFRHWLVNVKLVWAVVLNDILRTNYIFVLIGLFVVILSILQWLFSIEQLQYILFEQPNFSALDKIEFVVSGFGQIFLQWQDIVPISLMIIAVFQSLAYTILIKDRSKLKQYSSKSLLVGLLGAGCVACGGSILIPAITFFAAGASFVLIKSIGDILLLLAVVLSYRALSRIVYMYASKKY